MNKNIYTEEYQGIESQDINKTSQCLFWPNKAQNNILVLHIDMQAFISYLALNSLR